MTENPQHAVVFCGAITQGQQITQVKIRFGQLFKLNAETVDIYFSGQPVTLKKNCDKATAEKLQAALAQIGAVADILNSSSPTPSLSLAAHGSDLLRANERPAVDSVHVDTSHLKTLPRNPFSRDLEEPLEPTRDIPAPTFNLSAYQLAQPGANLGERRSPAPRDVDVSALSIAAVGVDLLREDDKLPIMELEFDLSDISLAEPGQDLGQIQQPTPPAQPETSHISLQQ